MMYTVPTLPSIESLNASSAARKAFDALALCLGRDDEGKATELVAFMKARGLTWPYLTKPAQNINLTAVLDILLDLSVNWRVSLWFDVSVWRLDSKGDGDSHLVVLGEPGHVPLLRMEELGGFSDAEYASALRDIAKFLTERSGSAPNGPTEQPFKDEEVLKELQSDESELRRELLSALGNEYACDTLKPLNVTTSLVPSEFRRDLESLLEKYVGLVDDRSVPVGDVLALNEPQFIALSKFISGVPAHRLLDVLGWMFAYSYSWVASSRLDHLGRTASPSSPAPPDSHQGVSTYVLCFVAVQETFGIAATSPLFVEKFTNEERNKVIAVLNTTTYELIDAAQADSIWRAAVTQAASTITSINLNNLWPPEPFHNLEVFDALYSTFPFGGSDFFRVWLESRTALRSMLSSRYYETLLTAKLRWYREDILYVGSLNTMSLSLAAIFPPSYWRHGSNVMTYAGLGVQFARQLAKKIYHWSRFGHPDEDSMARWNRSGGVGVFETPKEGKAIVDSLAVEVALATVKKLAAVDGRQLKLQGLEKFTTVQTFYMSYCSHFCGQSGARQMCDLAIDTSGFRDAFRCE
ncbi:hypothetical protein HPB48_008267 [Haemaphysalis longicornis]|uniref:Uncharacterized protein n=1 Tax=Haemaphysalis longicornis TaxID=44386 RepID=A0A9J6GPB4_HAELO|nr:hypothetical protein HPB48_008267 [Haemaphysalis longicornis]